MTRVPRGRSTDEFWRGGGGGRQCSSSSRLSSRIQVEVQVHEEKAVQVRY